MAHNGPVRLLLKGDRDAAARYVRLGRVLLWKLAKSALVAGVKSASRAYPLPDGGLIEVGFAGKIATITITVGGGEQLRSVIEGFYLTWGGTDPAKTPIMLLPPSGKPGAQNFVDWRASFFNADAHGYASTPEDRRVGTYAGTFGHKADEKGHRLLHGGGIWIDENDEAVTWFRGYIGYWPYHYRHPITNYSNVVCVYGHPVYTAPDPAWRVLSAAGRDGWLYVMICENLGAMNPPDLPPAPSYSGQVWASQPFTDEAYTYSLRRYPLAVVTEPDTGVQTYRADLEKTELLWRGDLELAYGAWSFNADCTACVTVQLPRVAVWGWYFVLRPEFEDRWVSSWIEQDWYPKVEAQRIEVKIEFENNTATASVAQELAPSLIAEENDIKLEIVEAEKTGPYRRVEYRCGDFTVIASESS